MIDTAVLWVRADAAMRASRWAEAAASLRKLIGVVDRIDFEYEEWLRAYAECLRQTGDLGHAAACSAYLGAVDARSLPELERAATALEAATPGTPEEARELLRLRLMGIYLARSNQAQAAARAFEAGRLWIHRAVELERAGEDSAAIAAWEHELDKISQSEWPYETALLRINLGLALYRKGDERARSALAAATGAVEEVADGFETEGVRERAFDCYQLLSRVGVESATFENIAEGLLNGVRILRDDGLKLDALRLYESFVVLAYAANEFHAAAVVLREAADFCLRVGLAYTDDLRLRAGDAWIAAGTYAQRAGHPVQIVENAFIAAAECYTAVRAFRRVAETYGRLANLEGQGKTRERYRRLLARLGDTPEDLTRPTPVPEFLKQLPEYEEVWYVDLTEWELAGDPLLIAATVMSDRRFPDFVRRHALLLVLDGDNPSAPLDGVELTRRFQSVRAYPVISALERLYRAGDLATKREVARAMGSLRFKRSFRLLEQALRAEHPDLRKDAADAVANLFFPHAFDRLKRIFAARDLPDAEQARGAALRAIGRINTPDALEFLCDRLRDQEPPFSDAAAHAITELGNAELVPLLRQQAELVPSMYRGAIEDTAVRLASRGR